MMKEMKCRSFEIQKEVGVPVESQSHTVFVHDPPTASLDHLQVAPTLLLTAKKKPCGGATVSEWGARRLVQARGANLLILAAFLANKELGIEKAQNHSTEA